MKKKVIIIAGILNGDKRAIIEGIEIDVNNYNSFLMSKIGGGWKKEEILILESPSETDLLKRISELSYSDYSTIIFAGHGGTVISNQNLPKQYICINNSSDFPVEKLQDGGDKRTIILDCCRGIESKELLIQETYFETSEFTNEMQRAREYYEDCIQKSNPSTIIMNACKLGEFAHADDEFGGYYTHFLISQSKKWYDENNSNSNTYLDVLSAHDATKELVSLETKGKQNPSISGFTRTAPYFPFAVNVAKNRIYG